MMFLYAISGKLGCIVSESFCTAVIMNVFLPYSFKQVELTLLLKTKIKALRTHVHSVNAKKIIIVGLIVLMTAISLHIILRMTCC